MNQMMHSGTVCLAMLALASTVAFAADQDGSDHDVAIETSAPAHDVTPLSVPLLSTVEYPADRPGWLKNAPVLEGDTHTWVIVTGPYDSIENCDERFAVDKRVATENYIKELNQKLHQSNKFDFYTINNQWVNERLVTREYVGTVTKGGVEMHEKAAQLTFTPDVQAEINLAWKKSTVRERLGAVGGVMFVGLTLAICGSMFLCMLSRRAERAAAKQFGTDHLGPGQSNQTGPIFVATVMGPQELPDQSWKQFNAPESESTQTSPLDFLSRYGVNSRYLFPPIICTVIYLLATPGATFWPKWVWFGCVVIPVLANWIQSDYSSEK